MADQKKSDPFQYDFDQQWDVERALYGQLWSKSTEPDRKQEDVDVFLPIVNGQVPAQTKEKAAEKEPDKEKKSRPTAVTADASTTGKSSRMPPQPRKKATPAGKKKAGKRPNYKGWAILAGMAITAILILCLLIWFFIWVLSPADGAIDEDATETSTTETVPTTTVDYDAIASGLLEEAELQSAMYDYDAAIATIKSFGSGWTQRTELTQAVQKFEQLKSQTVRWEDTTTIPHIFFHSLIADNARAFDGQYTEDGYNQYMTTIPEFVAMLEEMYARGFVLVRIHDIAKLDKDENGQDVYRQGDIYLPEGKKPIVMSQDDVNFYEYMIDSDGDHLPDAGGDGFATKLMVDDSGDITCEYVTAEGQTVYGDYDLVPILEHFVDEHPDFSYRGAKAIVALTGYEGVYGYRTDKDGKARLSPAEFQKEIDGAKEVTRWLNDNGWEIASHSYGHPAYGSLSWEELAQDVSRWEEEVQPVVGDTDIFIYPYGSDIAGIEEYSGSKYETMYDAGYRFYCNVDSADYWVQIWDDYVRQGRRNLDGYRLWYDPEMLDDLFDAEKVFDPDRPTPVPPI
ncbi:MAG: polysaccharide deacetylase family protein [Oscillospiraceae bacterium]|nr:polysaccharide deacetylase family protein [Oscillospiraceae bacterium]